MSNQCTFVNMKVNFRVMAIGTIEYYNKFNLMSIKIILNI